MTNWIARAHLFLVRFDTAFSTKETCVASGGVASAGAVGSFRPSLWPSSWAVLWRFLVWALFTALDVFLFGTFYLRTTAF